MLGRVLLLASPALTAIVTGTFYYLHVAINRWFEDREAARARATLQKAIEDPNVPEKDKQEFRGLLADFERTQIVRDIERVRVVGER